MKANVFGLFSPNFCVTSYKPLWGDWIVTLDTYRYWLPAEGLLFFGKVYYITVAIEYYSMAMGNWIACGIDIEKGVGLS